MLFITYPARPASQKMPLSLLDFFATKTIILGVIDVSRSRIELKDEVEHRIIKVLECIDRERLVIAPGCGLGLLSTSQAKQKIQVMCEVVAMI